DVAATRCRVAMDAARWSENLVAGARQRESDVSRALRDADERLRSHHVTQPGFWARLFRTRAARAWSDVRDRLATAHSGLEREIDDAQKEYVRANEQFEKATRDRQVAESAFDEARSHHQQSQGRITNAQERGVVLADESFFSVDHV